MLTLEDYLQDPCRTSSLPWWKAVSTTIPEDVLVLHEADSDPSILSFYSDDPYFRLIHPMQTVRIPELPAGFEIRQVSPSDLASHIDICYGGIGFTESTLLSYSTRRVHAPDCWLAIVDMITGNTVASGIGEIDIDIREGVLEWIQISPDYRRRGLGRCVVLELLRRM